MLTQGSLTTLRVLPVRVPSIDDDVSSLEVGKESFDDKVYGLTCTDHHHDFARTFDGGYEVLKIGEAKESLPSSTSRHKARDHFGLGAFCSVIDRHLEAIALHVEGEVLTHDS